MQDLLVPENLLNPVLVKKVKEIEAAEKAQVKGQKAQENAQEQGGQKAAGQQQKHEPQQQTAVTDVKQSGTRGCPRAASELRLGSIVSFK